MKFIKNKIKIFNLRWNKSMQQSELEENCPETGLRSSDHQVEYELGECSCSTEGCRQAYILGCIIEHNQQVLGSGSSCYMAFVRPYLECCSSGLPSAGRTAKC